MGNPPFDLTKILSVRKIRIVLGDQQSVRLWTQKKILESLALVEVTHVVIVCVGLDAK